MQGEQGWWKKLPYNRFSYVVRLGVGGKHLTGKIMEPQNFAIQNLWFLSFLL